MGTYRDVPNHCKRTHIIGYFSSGFKTNFRLTDPDKWNRIKAFVQYFLLLICQEKQLPPQAIIGIRLEKYSFACRLPRIGAVYRFTLMLEKKDGKTLRDVVEDGVEILAYDVKIDLKRIQIRNPIPVVL